MLGLAGADAALEGLGRQGVDPDSAFWGVSVEGASERRLSL